MSDGYMRMSMRERIRAEAEQSDLFQRSASAKRQQSALAGKTAIASSGAFEEGPQEAPEGGSKLRNVTSRSDKPNPNRERSYGKRRAGLALSL
jgi:hypothetical protein